MDDLLNDNGFWIFAGAAIFAVFVGIARHLNKGKEPQQFGDKVE